jgi:predicted ester cyclase
MMMRTIRAIGLCSTVLAAACSGNETKAPAPAAPPPAPAPLTIAQRAQWYQDCWAMFNDKAWDKFRNCYAADATSEQVDSEVGTARGRDAIIKASQDTLVSFPDAGGDVKLVLAHGPHLVSVAMWHGTHMGPLPGPGGKPIPPTKKPFGFLMAHWIETDAQGKEGLRDAAYVDEGTMMAQLGLVKAPARPVMASTPGAPTVVLARDDDAERKNAAAAQGMYDAFNRHDVKAMDAMTADNYVLHEVARPADLDKKANVAATAEFFKGFPDAKITTSEVWGAGDYVVVRGSITATNTGPAPSMGIKKPTGKSFTGKFLEIFRMQDGKVVEDWLFYNGAALVGQLGLT